MIEMAEEADDQPVDISSHGCGLGSPPHRFPSRCPLLSLWSGSQAVSRPASEAERQPFQEIEIFESAVSSPLLDHRGNSPLTLDF